MADGFRGAALNLAARLCAGASAGEIRVTDSLKHLAGPMPDLVFEPLEPVGLKGIDGTVTPWLVGTSTPPGGPRNTPPEALKDRAHLPPGLDSLIPLGGPRKPTCAGSGWHWRRARRGHSRTVGIMGPTGIGKTRLAAETGQAGVAGRVRGQVCGGWRTDSRQLARGGSLDRSPAPGDRRSGRGERAGTRGHGPSMGIPHPAWARCCSPSCACRARWRTSSSGCRPMGSARSGASTPMRSARSPPSMPSTRSTICRWHASRRKAMASRRRCTVSPASSPAPARAQRLGTSAERAASDRRGLRAAEEDVIREMAGLELATRRARLTTADADDAPTGDPSTMICPYKGLATFEAEDAAYFFGRERVVAELIARLVGSPFVAVVGASGSGKSSALRAGLLPALASGVLPGSDTWTTVVMRPGERPMFELRAALAKAFGAEERQDVVADLEQRLAAQSAGQRLLLVVDQFEEVFAATDVEGRDAFLELLTTPEIGTQGHRGRPRRPVWAGGRISSPGAAARGRPRAGGTGHPGRDCRDRRTTGAAGGPPSRAGAHRGAGAGRRRGARRTAAPVDGAPGAMAGPGGRTADLGGLQRARWPPRRRCAAGGVGLRAPDARAGADRPRRDAPPGRSGRGRHAGATASADAANSTPTIRRAWQRSSTR